MGETSPAAANRRAVQALRRTAYGGRCSQLGRARQGTRHRRPLWTDRPGGLDHGTFSKSFASLGGVIAGPEEIIFYIKHYARPMIFSASMTPSNAAAALAALDVMETEPEWVDRLWENTHYMLNGFKRLGYDTGPSESPVIPILIGDEFRTVGLWMGLFEEGVYTNPVLSPGVAVGSERLRTSYMATHTREHLDQVLKPSKKWASERNSRIEHGPLSRTRRSGFGRNPLRRVLVGWSLLGSADFSRSHCCLVITPGDSDRPPHRSNMASMFSTGVRDWTL